MLQIKKRAFTETEDTVLVLPLDFYLDKTCSGSSLTQIVLDDMSGGVPPYYPATDTFTSEALALANTSWSSTPNPGPVDVNYPETVAGTYWVAVKDSANTVAAKEIFADCFDPETALRHQVSVSSSTAATSNGVCAFSTQNVWIATRDPQYAQLDDVVFTAQTGPTRYDGSVNVVIGDWRTYVSGSLLNSNACFGDPNCTDWTEAIRISPSGIILELGCCNPPC